MVALWNGPRIIFMARVTLIADRLCTPDDITAITCVYGVHNKSGILWQRTEPVVVSGVLGRLRQDPQWGVDEIGFNFRHTIAMQPETRRWFVEYTFDRQDDDASFMLWFADDAIAKGAQT